MEILFFPLPSIFIFIFIFVSNVFLSISAIRIKFYPFLTLTAFAWAVRPSAFAKDIISSCKFKSASLLNDIILDFLIKSSIERGEKNLAVPPVGKTWRT